MKRLFFTVVLIAFSICGFSQFQTIPLKNHIGPLEGTVYNLPKTILIIEVETKRTIETPGKYFQYAERYLGLTDVCKSEMIKNEISSVKLILKPVPDNLNSYLLINKKIKNSKNTIDLTKDGFLKSINGVASENPGKQIFSPTLRTVLPKEYHTMESSIMTKEMQQSTSTAKIAELAASELFNIRETRLNILTQDIDKTPSDGMSYEIVLGELNRMEKYYSELFTGKREIIHEKKTFEVEPSEELESILFRFSQTNGIIDKSDLSGSPIYIKIKKQKEIKIENLSAKKDKKAKKEEPASLYYRLPGKAKVNITHGNDLLLEKEVTVSQFGEVLTLPDGEYVSVEMCPLTGSLLKLTE